MTNSIHLKIHSKAVIYFRQNFNNNLFALFCVLHDTGEDVSDAWDEITRNALTIGLKLFGITKQKSVKVKCVFECIINDDIRITDSVDGLRYSFPRCILS
eukprot:89437_1